jgi:CubicO group peptidase (beta-lactamase class C family)
MAALRRITRCAAPAVLLLSAACAPTLQSRSSDPLRDLDVLLERARTEAAIPGLALAIVRNDSIIYARGFGVREQGGNERVDEHTLFAIGSNSKAFTAAVVGKLVEEGRMRWDDPVTAHLPEFRLFDPYVTREITMRDVLSHRSGLGRRGDMIWYATPFDRAEVIRRVRHLEPNSSFRSEFGYQNIMFIAAGEAAARAGGRSWDELVTSWLLQPLGMHRSNTSVRDLARAGNVATPHTMRDGRVVPIAWRNIDNAGPAGSINSSVADMTQWVRMLLAGGELDGRRILDEATVRELQVPHTITGSGIDSLFPMRHFSAYGLGFGLSDYYGRKLLMHSGGIDGMLSTVALLPEERVGIVLLTNSDAHSVYSALPFDIIDRLIGERPRDLTSRAIATDAAQRAAAAEAERRRAAERVSGTRPSLALGDYVGPYESPLYGTLDISLESGQLVARRYDTLRAPLEHWHYNTFRATWSDAAFGTTLITFALDADGTAATLEIEGLGRFRRVREPGRDR